MERFVFASLEGGSDISSDHGEDEFILTSFDTRVSSTTDMNGDKFSSFTFRFEAPRHLSYYIFRIFVPISLLILVNTLGLDAVLAEEAEPSIDLADDRN